MIILYRDKSGEDTVNSSNQRKSSELKTNTLIPTVRPDASQLEEKVIFLERKLAEQENTINRMKNEMEKSREVRCLMRKLMFLDTFNNIMHA